MIMDKLLEFDPAGTLITVTAVSTNVIDLHGASLIPTSTASVRPGRDLGIGSAMGAVPKLMCMVTTTFLAAGAATLQVQIQGAPDDGTNTNTPGAYATYAETPAIAKATLVAGNRIFDIDLPRMLPTPPTPVLIPRFLRLNYPVATGPFTAGAIQSELVLARDDSPQYPVGITVAN